MTPERLKINRARRVPGARLLQNSRIEANLEFVQIGWTRKFVTVGVTAHSMIEWQSSNECPVFFLRATASFSAMIDLGGLANSRSRRFATLATIWMCR